MRNLTKWTMNTLALLIASTGCEMMTGEAGDNSDVISGAWQAAIPQPRPFAIPGAPADASSDSISYIMLLDYNGARVQGIIEASTDTTGHPKLLEGFLRLGSPDMMLLTYDGCSMYGEAPGDDRERRYTAERICGEATDTLVFVPASTGWIEGTVTEDDAAADAESIYAYRPGTDWIDGARTETNASGSYRLTGLQPGDQIVKVILSCYPNPSEKATVVEAGTIATVNFTC